ncbi:MAG: TIGR03118 family protein [Bryobacteraceae bacterium]
MRCSQMSFRSMLRLLVPLGAVLSLTMVWGQNYAETDLVANQSGTAMATDPNLVNAWGLSRSSGSPWWVANAGSGTSTLHQGDGTAVPLVVTIPALGNGKGSPTGTVYNGGPGFELAPGMPAAFLFVTEDGLIAGWNSKVNPTTAVVMVKSPGASYTGVAIATWNGQQYLYAADFKNGRIDVFDSSFNLVSLGYNAFHPAQRDDEGTLGPFNLSPYNVQNIGGTLFVAFAKLDPSNGFSTHAPGAGRVAAFAPNGQLIRQYQEGIWFNAPWGLALAPGDFGSFSHDLLVGNFGNGQILAFNASSGKFDGYMLDASGKTISIPLLWALSFGSGGAGKSGSATSLFFTAIGGTGGLFGTLDPVPSTLVQGNSN